MEPFKEGDLVVIVQDFKDPKKKSDEVGAIGILTGGSPSAQAKEAGYKYVVNRFRGSNDTIMATIAVWDIRHTTSQEAGWYNQDRRINTRIDKIPEDLVINTYSIY